MSLIDIMTEKRYMTDGISMVRVKWKDLKLRIIHHVQMFILWQVPIPIKRFAWVGCSMEHQHSPCHPDS